VFKIAACNIVDVIYICLKSMQYNIFHFEASLIELNKSLPSKAIFHAESSVEIICGYSFTL
jgi:hypothetical protein